MSKEQAEFTREFLTDKSNSRIMAGKIRELETLMHQDYVDRARWLRQMVPGYEIIVNELTKSIESLRKNIKKWEIWHNICLGKADYAELNIKGAKEVDIPLVFGGDNRVRRKVVMYCCPIHKEKTPSFAWYPANNRWYCFGACGRGGDAIDLYQLINGCNFVTAVKELNLI
jgi:hypothetical protein